MPAANCTSTTGPATRIIVPCNITIASYIISSFFSLIPLLHSSCTTDEDYLAAIEAFEDNPPVADAGVSDQTRIADALEDMVALSLPDAE